MVNQYYFYCVDEDFGPFFLKFCSYFPYNAKLCDSSSSLVGADLIPLSSVTASSTWVSENSACRIESW